MSSETLTDNFTVDTTLPVAKTVQVSKFSANLKDLIYDQQRVNQSNDTQEKAKFEFPKDLLDKLKTETDFDKLVQIISDYNLRNKISERLKSSADKSQQIILVDPNNPNKKITFEDLKTLYKDKFQQEPKVKEGETGDKLIERISKELDIQIVKDVQVKDTKGGRDLDPNKENQTKTTPKGGNITLPLIYEGVSIGYKEGEPPTSRGEPVDNWKAGLPKEFLNIMRAVGQLHVEDTIKLIDFWNKQQKLKPESERHTISFRRPSVTGGFSEEPDMKGEELKNFLSYVAKNDGYPEGSVGANTVSAEDLILTLPEDQRPRKEDLPVSFEDYEKFKLPDRIQTLVSLIQTFSDPTGINNALVTSEFGKGVFKFLFNMSKANGALDLVSGSVKATDKLLESGVVATSAYGKFVSDLLKAATGEGTFEDAQNRFKQNLAKSNNLSSEAKKNLNQAASGITTMVKQYTGAEDIEKGVDQIKAGNMSEGLISLGWGVTQAASLLLGLGGASAEAKLLNLQTKVLGRLSASGLSEANRLIVQNFLKTTLEVSRLERVADVANNGLAVTAALIQARKEGGLSATGAANVGMALVGALVGMKSSSGDSSVIEGLNFRQGEKGAIYLKPDKIEELFAEGRLNQLKREYRGEITKEVEEQLKKQAVEESVGVAAFTNRKDGRIYVANLDANASKSQIALHEAVVEMEKKQLNNPNLTKVDAWRQLSEDLNNKGYELHIIKLENGNSTIAVREAKLDENGRRIAKPTSDEDLKYYVATNYSKSELSNGEFAEVTAAKIRSDQLRDIYRTNSENINLTAFEKAPISAENRNKIIQIVDTLKVSQNKIRDFQDLESLTTREARNSRMNDKLDVLSNTAADAALVQNLSKIPNLSEFQKNQLRAIKDQLEAVRKKTLSDLSTTERVQLLQDVQKQVSVLEVAKVSIKNQPEKLKELTLKIGELKKIEADLDLTRVISEKERQLKNTRWSPGLNDSKNSKRDILDLQKELTDLKRERDELRSEASNAKSYKGTHKEYYEKLCDFRDRLSTFPNDFNPMDQRFPENLRNQYLTIMSEAMTSLPPDMVKRIHPSMPKEWGPKRNVDGTVDPKSKDRDVDSSFKPNNQRYEGILKSEADKSKSFEDLKRYRWVKCPNGEQHGGLHYDVQRPDGSHANIFPYWPSPKKNVSTQQLAKGN